MIVELTSAADWRMPLLPMSLRSNRRAGPARRAAALGLCLTLAAAPALAQTRITPPKNKYTPEQDVQIGEEAAAEVRRTYPIITNDEVQSYLETLGERLVQAAPPELNKPAFHYSFTPVNVKEINAFALPGGPMFINRGMIDSAQSEGEIVGVMAHELSHVLLRHGTANATKAQGFQLGALAGAIAGAVVGGSLGSLIAQGSQFGLGTWMLRYSRDYEKQADLLGTQIMARAGYDPRDLARVFENIEKQGGAGSPQWMSDHPNPGNRTQYINDEASHLQVANIRHDASELRQVKAQLARLPPPKSMAEVERNAKNGGDGGTAPASTGTIGQPVPPPSTSYRSVRAGNVLQASVPSNWQSLSADGSVKFVPPNGYGAYNGQTVFTHGAEFGIVRAQSRDLSEATQALLQGLASGNPQLREAADPERIRLSNRTAIHHRLVNQSATGEQERVGLYTAFLNNGDLFYYVTVVPSDEAGSYEPAFSRIADSIRLLDR
jgi:Zn-dependent protease with chaperone function